MEQKKVKNFFPNPILLKSPETGAKRKQKEHELIDKLFRPRRPSTSIRLSTWSKLRGFLPTPAVKMLDWIKGNDQTTEATGVVITLTSQAIALT